MLLMSTTSARISILAACLAPAGPALSQGVDVPITRPRTAADSHIEVQYGHLFETNTNNGGNVERDTASLTASPRFALSDTVGFSLQGAYHLASTGVSRRDGAGGSTQ